MPSYSYRSFLRLRVLARIGLWAKARTIPFPSPFYTPIHLDGYSSIPCCRHQRLMQAYDPVPFLTECMTDPSVRHPALSPRDDAHTILRCSHSPTNDDAFLGQKRVVHACFSQFRSTAADSYATAALRIGEKRHPVHRCLLFINLSLVSRRTCASFHDASRE